MEQDLFPDGADEPHLSVDAMEPSEADIAAMEGDVSRKELKRKHLKKGIKKELKRDDAQHIFEMCDHPLLKRDEEAELARAASAGDASARDRMILCNQRLVVSIAKRYRNLGMDFIDLVSEGNVGLLRALDKYDVERGFKFATFATWWIRQTISRSLADKGRSIRIPVHVVNQLYNMRKIEGRIFAETGEEPTKKQLSAELGLPEAEIEFLKRARKHPASLSAPVGKNDDGEMGALIAAAGKNMDIGILNADIRRMIAQAMEAAHGLTETELSIFTLRAGLDDERKRAKDIGDHMGKNVTWVKAQIGKMRRKLRKFPLLLALLDGTPIDEGR